MEGAVLGGGVAGGAQPGWRLGGRRLWAPGSKEMPDQKDLGRPGYEATGGWGVGAVMTGARGWRN